MDGNICQQPGDHEENPKGVSEMCRVMENMCKEARETGRAEGRISTMIESVRSPKARLGLSDHQARDALNISNDEWERIALSV